MANPPNLFRPDGRLDELVLHVRPWSDDVLDKLGFDARSPAVSSHLAGQHFLGTSRDETDRGIADDNASRSEFPLNTGRPHKTREQTRP